MAVIQSNSANSVARERMGDRCVRGYMGNTGMIEKMNDDELS